MAKGELSRIFRSMFLLRAVSAKGKWCACTWRRLRNDHVLLHVRANEDSPVSLAMTHVRWLHGQSGRESTDHTVSVDFCVGGLTAWPIDYVLEQGRGQK